MKTFRFAHLLVLSLLSAGLAGPACRRAAPAPSGCQLVRTEGSTSYTYQYTDAGQLTAMHGTTSSGDADYAYTYQGQQATLAITYPKTDWLKYEVSFTLNAQGYATLAQETLLNRLADGTWNSSLNATYTLSYDATGHLLRYHRDQFAYPPGQPKQTTQLDVQLGYQGGNPTQLLSTELSPTLTSTSWTISHQFDSRPNPLKIPLLVENSVFGLNIPAYVLPFAGQPATNLVTAQQITQNGKPFLTDAFAYTLDASGRITQGSRPNSGTSFTLATTCP